MTEQEIRELLEQILTELEQSYTWVTGEIDFAMKSGDVMTGRLEYLEPASAIIRWRGGLRSVVLKSVEELRVYHESPEPE